MDSSDKWTESRWLARIAEVNRELWLLLSLFAIAGLLNWLVADHGMVLSLYTLPTLFSAYVYGRRHAVLTAVASILLVATIVGTNLQVLAGSLAQRVFERWFDVTVWGGLLIVTAYAMGSLYDRQEAHLRELRRTYFGVLTILRSFVSNDQYSHHHSRRVALYASAIASHFGFDEQRLDDIRAAALLHDLGKLETSREVLRKAASLNSGSLDLDGRDRRERFGSGDGSLKRVLPIVLAHHVNHHDSGPTKPSEEAIPLEARILDVADTYDTLTSDHTYRRAITPFDAKEIIVKGAGTSFDSKVVGAFVLAFDARKMEIPEAIAFN